MLWTSSLANKVVEQTAAATIHVAGMKNGHSLDLRNGERSGNTTAPNRSTVIKTRFWIETIVEKSAKKGISLHKAWPNWPPISQEFVCNFDSLYGIQIIEYNRSDMDMLAMK